MRDEQHGQPGCGKTWPEPPARTRPRSTRLQGARGHQGLDVPVRTRLCAGLGNGLLLGYLMYRSGLVPPRMALLGVIGGPLSVVGAIFVLFGAWEQTSPIQFIFTILEIALRESRQLRVRWSCGHFGPDPGVPPKRSERVACAVLASIGVMREGPLHAAVKALLAEPGDRLEVPVGRFVVDLVRADGELVEVQTGGFGALGNKLDALLDEHRIRVVHPVAAERRIVRVDEQRQVLGVRRSPKRATAVAVFDKLVAFPSLLTHPNLTIEVLLLREDHIRRPQPTTTRRRTRDPGERRLVEVLDRVALRTPEDILAALPTLPLAPFSTRELAALLRCSTLLARRTLYCLRMIGIVEPAGKRGRAPLHARTARDGSGDGSRTRRTRVSRG